MTKEISFTGIEDAIIANGAAVIRDGKVIDFMLSLDYDAHTVQITEAQIEEYKTRLNELLDK